MEPVCVDCNIALWVDCAFVLFALIAVFIAYFKELRLKKPSVAAEEGFGVLYLSLLFGFVITIAVFAVYHRGNPLVGVLFTILGLVVLFGIFRDLDTIFVILLIGFLLTVLVMIFTQRGSIVVMTCWMLVVIYFYYVFGKTCKKYSSHNMQQLKQADELME